MPSFVTEQVNRIAHKFSSSPWDATLRRDWERFLKPRLEQLGEVRLFENVSEFIDNETFLDQSQFDKHRPGIKVQIRTCPKCAVGDPSPGWIRGKAVDKDGKEYECVKSCKHDAA